MKKIIKLSFCAVIKDKLPNVKRLFNNIRELTDEIIIIDTGSGKSVTDYEKKNSDKVFEIPWNNDFAYMRNFAIKYSKGKWILTLDSDETITEELKSKIKQIIDKKNNNIEGYKLKRIHYTDEVNPLPDYWMHLRLYKHHAHYFGAVHESIKNLRNLKKVGCQNCFILHHNNRVHQREKSIAYSSYLADKIKQAKEKKDWQMLEYYNYKLWVQDNVYLPETDSDIDYKELKNKYAEYENKKKYIEDKIKEEKWEVEK